VGAIQVKPFIMLGHTSRATPFIMLAGAQYGFSKKETYCSLFLALHFDGGWNA